MSSTLWTYNQIIQRLEVFADGHYFLQAFTHGQLDVKDLEKFPEYPRMHVAPEGFDYAPGSKVFNLRVLVFDKPRQVEEKPEYQREVISDCQQVIEDLVYELKNGRTLFGKEVDTPDNFTIDAFMESFENVVTGCEALISITVPNRWSACNIPADWGTQGGGGGNTPPANSGLVLKTNGTVNAVQNILDLVAGSNITLTDLGDGRVRIAATGGSGGGLTCDDLAACQTIIDILADIDTVTGDLASHIANVSNPHSVTKSQVGLGNVDNTSDANKPISSATQTALNAKEPTITAGTTAQYWRGDKSWQTLDKSAVGLSNVDNTSDANKPVSTAQAAADSAVQSFSIQRANHTGTQPVNTISDATTVGQNIVKLTNPSAIRYLRINADNTVTAIDADTLGAELDDGIQAGTPAATGFISKTEDILRYHRSKGSKICHVMIRIVGTSNATTFTFTLPFAAANTHIQRIAGNIQNNTTNSVAYWSTTAGSTTATVTTATGGAFTASGTKGLTCNGHYETT